MEKLFGAIVLVVALSGCSKQAEIGLRNEVNSLQQKVTTSKQENATLRREINKYIASMKLRANEIEHELAKTPGAASYSHGMVPTLKEDLSVKTTESNALRGQFAFYKGVSDTLRMIVESQAAELRDGAEILAATQQELLKLHEEINQLNESSATGDSYNDRAAELEEIAKRTHSALEKSKSL